MSTQEIPAVRPAGSSARSALVEHLRDPMRRSSYALILGTGLTSGLGLLFWILAARWLPTATVGIGAALVSAMALLANLSTLGLRNGLIRFLPEAGSGGRKLIATGYVLCAGTAMATAGVFLLGQPWWADQLAFLRSTPLASVLFALAVAVWVIFVLQDNVLLALRRTEWVPVVNGICSVAKIALLPLLAFSAVWAIFAATVLPAAAAVLVVTAVVLRRPRRSAGEAAPISAPISPSISIGRLVRFAVTDHLAALLWLGTADLLTLVILQEVGPEASAYYFIANTIGYSLYLITSNVGSALVAEGARQPERRFVLARQALINAARLVIPLTLVGGLLAPMLLGLLGRDYAENGTLLLQLILISAVPQIVVAVAMSTARLRHDLKLIITIYAAQAVGVLGGSWLLIRIWGLTGAGIAVVVTATVLATVLLLSGRTGLWPEREGPERSVGLALPTARWLQRFGSLRRSRRGRRELRNRLVPARRAVGLDPVPAGYELLTSDCDTLIVVCADRPELIKIATSPAASAGLDRHAEMLDWLGRRPELTHFAGLLPRPLARGAVDGNRVLLETRLPGRAAQPLGLDRGLDDAVTAAALTAISELHTATARPRTVDAELLREWVAEPLAPLRGLPGLAGCQAALDRIAETFAEGLGDRELSVSATHGDFWPGNVLISDVLITSPETGVEVTGIVDWENGRRVGLPDTDLLHWRLAAQPVELGTAVRRVLQTGDGLDVGVPLPNPQVDRRHLLLLTWLWHVSAGLTRATRNPLGRVWLARNVHPVVHLFKGSRTR